jgi:hypothetical protein
VHFANLPRVNKGLARMYVEAMLPALLGYQDVVFDRSWLSELPYGEAYRHGADRLGHARVRMLERLAMRCGAVVVHCRPPWEAVEAKFLERQNDEYLDNVKQLRTVYDVYGTARTGLPEYIYDYTNESKLKVMHMETFRMPRHAVDVQSAGNLDGKIVLVGDKFTHHKEHDSYYQWPFASFDKSGCSHWLTTQLMFHNIPEDEILWVNADQDISSVVCGAEPDTQIIALGELAAAKLQDTNREFIKVQHPEYPSCNLNQEYELFKYI